MSARPFLSAFRMMGVIKPPGVATATDTISWTVLWRAPSNATVPIELHVAANASNDDDSELGDAVYTLEQRVAPP